MRFKRICFFCLSLLMLVPNLFAEKNLPYKGRVTGSRINVRGGYGVNNEVLTQVNLGDDLDVIDEQEGWCKVRLPYGISTWLYAKLLKDGKVARDIVNVRSGPAVHYSILATLKRGDSVEIIEDHGEWVKIKAPADTGGWITSDFVRYLCPIEDYDKWLITEKDGKAEFEELEAFRKKELFKSIEEVDFNLIISKYEKFINKYKELPEAQIAQEIILDTKEKNQVAIVKDPYREEKSPTPIVEKVKDKSFKGQLKKIEEFSVSMPTATHYLKKSGFFGSSTKCFLQSEMLDLVQYEGKKVVIWGEVLSDKKIPLVLVTKVEVK